MPRWWHVQVRLKFQAFEYCDVFSSMWLPGLCSGHLPTDARDCMLAKHRQLREFSIDEVHYADRVSAAQLDPRNALGEEKLAALCEKHTKRVVAIELTNQYCTWCGEETDYFMELVCSSVCRNCYREKPELEMCSVEYAKMRSRALHNLHAATIVLA
jgi:hypothetical protein